MIERVCKKHFLLKNFRYHFLFFRRNNLHPFFQALPFSEHDEEVIFADFIECLNLIEPLFDWNELNWLGIDEFTNSFTTKSVIVFNFILDNLVIRNYLHVIMIVLEPSNHINELICSELFLTHHFEKGGNFAIVNGL